MCFADLIKFRVSSVGSRFVAFAAMSIARPSRIDRIDPVITWSSSATIQTTILYTVLVAKNLWQPCSFPNSTHNTSNSSTMAAFTSNDLAALLPGLCNRIQWPAELETTAKIFFRMVLGKGSDAKEDESVDELLHKFMVRSNTGPIEAVPFVLRTNLVRKLAGCARKYQESIH